MKKVFLKEGVVLGKRVGVSAEKKGRGPLGNTVYQILIIPAQSLRIRGRTCLTTLAVLFVGIKYNNLLNKSHITPF